MDKRPADFPRIMDQQYWGYMDYFGENDTDKPIILEDGTSVSFPDGWTDEDADKWRKGMELQAPGSRTVIH
jgi:hypothetical protein